MDQLIKSVKKRAQEQGRQFSFFEKDEAAAALVNLEKESAACSEILESVANNTPQGEALKLDLSQIDQQKLRGALDTCKAVGVTIDSRVRLHTCSLLSYCSSASKLGCIAILSSRRGRFRPLLTMRLDLSCRLHLKKARRFTPCVLS